MPAVKVKDIHFWSFCTEVEPGQAPEECSASGSGGNGERKTHQEINGTPKS